MICNQPPTDDALSPLLAKIGEVYALMTKRQESAKIPSMVRIYGQMARQTLECTDFIVHYSEKKNFCESNVLTGCLGLTVVWIGKRVGKYISEETFATIQNYIEVLNSLMQQSRHQTTRDIILYRMGKGWPQTRVKPSLTITISSCS